MTSYPQQPLNGVTRGLAENRLADPGVRLILSMSPQNGAVKPLPENLDFQELSNGSFKVTFPDGSIRELVPGAEGEGRMVTTLPDGTRIQSDLMMTDGQVTIASISSTGEKTFLSLNENGANMQRITSDGEVSNVIPESAPELIQSFREAEAFSQAEELREQVQFQANSDFGEWNNFGKPADWQPEQNWQPPQQFGEWNNFGKPADWQPEQNWQPPQFDGGYNQPIFNQPSAAFMPPQQFGEFMPPQGNWQPPQQFGEWNNYGKPADWQPEQNWQPPQFDGGYNQPIFNQPPTPYMPLQGNWQPPQFMQPTQNWQPLAMNYATEQFATPANVLDALSSMSGTTSYGDMNQIPLQQAEFIPPQFMQPTQFDGGYNQPIFNQLPAAYIQPQQNWQPQPTDGFLPSAPTDSSGFLIGPSDANAFATQNLLNVDSVFANAPDFGSVIEAMPVDSVDDSNSIQQIPPQY